MRLKGFRDSVWGLRVWEMRCVLEGRSVKAKMLSFDRWQVRREAQQCGSAYHTGCAMDSFASFANVLLKPKFKSCTNLGCCSVALYIFLFT